MAFFSWLLSQSKPSYSPSPDVAHVACKEIHSEIHLHTFRHQRRTWMYQFLFLRLWRPSLSVISAAFIALGKSCLLANISRTASLNSSSASILINSSRASPIRSLRRTDYRTAPHWYNWPVVAVHDEDESLGVLEVVSPERSDLVLAAHIPHCEADVFVFYCLHVESYREKYCYEGMINS